MNQRTLYSICNYAYKILNNLIIVNELKIMKKKCEIKNYIIVNIIILVFSYFYLIKKTYLVRVIDAIRMFKFFLDGEVDEQRKLYKLH